MAMCLSRHLAVGHVIDAAPEIAVHVPRSAGVFPGRVRAPERVEVARDGVMAIDHRVLAVERAPEVVDFRRIGAAQARLQREQPRPRGDEQCHRACSLRRLAGAAQRVASDIGADHQGGAPARGARSDPVHRGEQSRGAAEAGVLRLVRSRPLRQPDQPMQPGGDLYPTLIRKTRPAKPIRVFLQDGSNDLDNNHGAWFLANQQMAAALKFSGYDYKTEWGHGTHNPNHGGAILPDSLRWLWRDYGKPAQK